MNLGLNAKWNNNCYRYLLGCASKEIYQKLLLYFLNNPLYIYCAGWIKWFWFQTMETKPQSFLMALTAASPTLSRKLEKPLRKSRPLTSWISHLKVETRHSAFQIKHQFNSAQHCTDSPVQKVLCAYIWGESRRCVHCLVKRVQGLVSQKHLYLYLEQLIHLAQLCSQTEITPSQNIPHMLLRNMAPLGNTFTLVKNINSN